MIVSDSNNEVTFIYGEENDIKTLTAEDGNTIFALETEFDQAVQAMKKTTTGDITIDGLYVDNTYRSKKDEDDGMRLLYVVYSVTPQKQNLELDAESMEILVGDNLYSSERVSHAAEYMGNCYYKEYLKDVNLGTTVKFVETFKVPAVELEKGKRIVLWQPQVSETDRMLMSTDDIQFVDGKEEVAKLADPDGYAKEVEKRKEADAATTKKVKEAINGYAWMFSMPLGTGTIEFFAPNKFELKSGINLGSRNLTNTTGGTYTVQNGYITTVNDVGAVVMMPYKWKDNGDIDIDFSTGYDPTEW